MRQSDVATMLNREVGGPTNLGGGGSSRNVVGIICHPHCIGLMYLPKSGGAISTMRQSDMATMLKIAVGRS